MNTFISKDTLPENTLPENISPKDTLMVENTLSKEPIEIFPSYMWLNTIQRKILNSLDDNKAIYAYEKNSEYFEAIDNDENNCSDYFTYLNFLKRKMIVEERDEHPNKNSAYLCLNQ